MFSASFVFFLAFTLVAKGVEGADGDLNAPCLSGNTCTDTTNHCCDTNRTPNVCKIKNAKPCTDVADCVAGAVCTNPPAACACTPVITTTDPSGRCNPNGQRVGGVCEDPGLPCNDPNATCTGGHCVCAAGYVTKYIDYACAEGSNGHDAATVSFVLLLASFLTSRCV